MKQKRIISISEDLSPLLLVLQDGRPRETGDQGSTLVGLDRVRAASVFPHRVTAEPSHPRDQGHQEARRGHLQVQSRLSQRADAQLSLQPHRDR